MDSLTSRLPALSHLNFTWRDALDILIVAFITYGLLRLIRGTRAVQMVLGLFAISLVYGAASFLKLPAVTTVMKALIFYVPFLIIVLFSHELRRALAAFGRTPFFALFSGYHAEETISEIVLAVTSLSARRVGALIVLERREGLKTYIENGSQIDSAVSYELLVTLFAPGTPLHDGAVIITGDRIAAAACFLPLSLKEGLPKRFGTRHRAAVGITEETDAVAILVSEERGTISLSQEGQLQEDLDAKALRDLLLREFAAQKSPA
jgi:diadenylate cyclase